MRFVAFGPQTLDRHDQTYGGPVILDGKVCSCISSRFLKTGDVVEVEIQGIGTLKNTLLEAAG